jgi:tetratricopeptide (TPR) repeat protein
MGGYHMHDSRWDQIDDWFARALDRPEEERAEFLAGCPDEELRRRVERLLAAAGRSGDLLSSGAIARFAAFGRDVVAEARSAFPPGRELLGRYRVVDELGSGGFGVVYRARDLELEREVAIKVVAGSDTQRERLKREARAAAATNHPNLVGVYDVGEVDGIPFLVMELVEGPTLEQDPPRSVEEAVAVAIRLCEALEHLHGRGLVHRDLKPGNVLRVGGTDDRTVKLVDFGLVRGERVGPLTVEGHILGTPAFMAPEHARGQPVDARTDLYALGVMLYRWVTGRLPFDSEDPMALVAQHLHAPLVPPTDLVPDLSPDLEQVIVRLMAKDPRHRFATASEVVAALRGLDVAKDEPRPPAAVGDGPSLETARRAFREGDWGGAFQAYGEAMGETELTPNDHAKRAAAAMWSGHYDDIVSALEQAAAGFTRAGQTAGAANVACELANVHFERRETKLAEGWLRRAERVLPDLPEGRTHAYAKWIRSRCDLARADYATARERASSALDIARRVGDRDCEALSLLELGHLSMLGSDLEEGTAFLDDAGAMAMSGELGPFAAGTVLCGVIFAWRALGNWGRAAEWTQAQTRWCEREKVAIFPGLCRIHRGELIRLRGELERAEQDLERGAEELVRIDRWVAGVGFRELGEVRLRRGNLRGAEEAFKRALELGSDAQPGLARLRLLEGDVTQALEELRRALATPSDHFLDTENRGYVLPVLVTVALAVGRRDEAERAVEELERLADATGSSAYRAGASAARGELLLAEGNVAAAIERLQQARRRWCEIDAPYEAAEVQIKLAEALVETGDRRGACLQLAAALSVFEQLGADMDAGGTRRRLAQLRSEQGAAAATPSPRAWACVEIIGSARLIEAIGEEGWNDFEGWLRRTLGNCCTAHGGTAERSDEGSRFTAAFPSVDDAVRCAVQMQQVLLDHRSRHGFAPPARAGVVDGDPDTAVERAGRLASLGAAGDVLTLAGIASRTAWSFTVLDSAEDAVRVLWRESTGR